MIYAYRIGKQMKLLVAAVVILCITACVGAPFKWDDARKLREGMTIPEVTALIGSPTAVNATGDVLRYVWVEVNGFTGSTKTLSVDFRDGRLAKVPPIPPSF
jgi:outer membrane protein assembly factor BamE (lipoprotein component of BamABCDE complex)